MYFYIQTMLNGLMYGCTYSLIAIGFTMIFGTMNLINLAHGDVIMVGTFVGIVLVTYLKLNLVTTFFGSLIGAVVIGLLVERFCFRPLRTAHELAPLISTVGASIIIQEVFTKVFGSYTVEFPNSFTFSGINVGQYYIRTNYLIVLILGLVFMVITYLLINKTKLGRAMRATAENFHAASLMGININRVYQMTFVVASALGGAAGFLLGISTSSGATTMGFTATLKGLVVIVLGGMGSIPGAMLGGILLGIVEFEGKIDCAD